MQTLQLVT